MQKVLDSIELMVYEHENIIKMVGIMRRASERIIEKNTLNTHDFRLMIDFIKTYADRHHHGKEEQILFLEMQGRLGDVGKNLITHGMLVEHDLARFYVSELSVALDEYDLSPTTAAKVEIIANTIAYAKLLTRHIEKEDNVIYKYARKNLDSDTITDINRRTEVFERQANQESIAKQLVSLKMLEEKYAKNN